MPVRAGTAFASHPARRYYRHAENIRMSGRAPIKRVPKPWGHETIWAHTESYVGKILHITAGEALSVQYHNIKDETVYLLILRYCTESASPAVMYRIFPT